MEHQIISTLSDEVAMLKHNSIDGCAMVKCERADAEMAMAMGGNPISPKQVLKRFKEKKMRQPKPKKTEAKPADA